MFSVQGSCQIATVGVVDKAWMTKLTVSNIKYKLNCLFTEVTKFLS